MKLLLSSAALPDGSLTDLARGALQRNFEGLEVIVGAGHEHPIEATSETGSSGVSPSGVSPPKEEGSNVPVQWLLLEEGASTAEVLYWGRRAHLLRTGLVLPDGVTDSPVGVPTALRHPTDRAAAQRALAWAQMHGAKTCWEVEVGRASMSEMENALEVTAPRLAHVRLLGAGPEPETDEPSVAGTSDVLKALTLRGYKGTVALAPSPVGRREAWRAWLFKTRGWGCNTAAKKKARS
jgi:hypothetical protein